MGLLRLRLYEGDGQFCDCRVPAGDECYFCWDDRRRENPGKDQNEVNQQIKACRKFSDKHTQTRAHRVQSARKVGQQGLQTNVVIGEEGAFRQEFDEGHFYELDDWLSVHCSGRTFNSTRAKVEAVEAMGETVHRDPRGRARLKLVFDSS